jgi:hypothetical protein
MLVLVPVGGYALRASDQERSSSFGCEGGASGACSNTFGLPLHVKNPHVV